MAFDVDDTIVAIASAAGGAARGIVRISGPQAVACLESCFSPADVSPAVSELERPQVLTGALQILGGQSLPSDVFVWPTSQSYTRQPTVEIHTLGSAPLLEAVLEELCRHDARLAEPGEFTLRAFLAGRLDLTQAEAVLGVIDAHGDQDLQNALQQLAGGLSRPLNQLREQLIQVLAELEAGLDFVEEDIEFISSDKLLSQLSLSQETLQSILNQMSSRVAKHDLPRVVLVGPPNVGKSSLFNALREFSPADPATSEAIVSPQSGTTRDYLSANVLLGGIECELIDTAGEEQGLQDNSIQQMAQAMTGAQRTQATLLLRCMENKVAELSVPCEENELIVLTKSDLEEPSHLPTDQFLRCSSVTGDGMKALETEIGHRLSHIIGWDGTAVASTASRCHESLRLADESLSSAKQLAESMSGEELIAAEIRIGLYELGRVVGTVYTDDILDRIFSQFCIGK